MADLDNERLSGFFKETLDLWQVAGTVEVGASPLVAIIRAHSGAIVWIERFEPPVRPERSKAESKDEQPSPFRWGVRWRAADEAAGAPRELRPRPCGSLVGVLSAVRTALDVDRGTPVRIAATPASPHSS